MCPICELKPETFDKLTEEQAHALLLGKTDAWCVNHRFAYIFVRKATPAMGRELVDYLRGVEGSPPIKTDPTNVVKKGRAA